MNKSNEAPLFVSLPKGKDIKESKCTIPLSVMTLYNYLYSNNILAKFIDLAALPHNNESLEDYLSRELLQNIKQSYPLYLGINCFTTGQFPLLSALARRIKEIYPQLPIVIGGMHPTLFAKDIIDNCPYIDYVIIGEGEQTALDLVKVCLGEKEILPFIQALAWRDEHKNTHVNERKTFMQNLDVAFEPAWKQLDIKKYHVNTENWNNPKKLSFSTAIPIATTRSCPFSCSFCSVAGHMGRKLRFRDPYAVVNEIEFLHKEYGQNYFEFIDDNINVNKNHALNIFREINKRQLNIHFSLTNGVHINSADEEIIDVMYEAGLAMIKLPIEHGNDYIRNTIIGKNTSKEKILSIAKHIKQYDIFSFGLFIVGFPEETDETIRDTIDLIHELALDMNPIALLIPFAGTRVYDQCVKDNLLIKKVDTQKMYTGSYFLDAFAQEVYIKPYAMTIQDLLEHKKTLDSLHVYSEKAKKINNII